MICVLCCGWSASWQLDWDSNCSIDKKIVYRISDYMHILPWTKTVTRLIVLLISPKNWVLCYKICVYRWASCITWYCGLAQFVDTYFIAYIDRHTQLIRGTYTIQKGWPASIYFKHKKQVIGILSSQPIDLV